MGLLLRPLQPSAFDVCRARPDKKLYKPRTCRFPITREGIEQGKYKPCLEYHIKNCGAPCIGKQSYEEYQESIAQAREILKGNTRELSKMLFAQMQKLAEELRLRRQKP